MFLLNQDYSRETIASCSHKVQQQKLEQKKKFSNRNLNKKKGSVIELVNVISIDFLNNTKSYITHGQQYLEIQLYTKKKTVT